MVDPFTRYVPFINTQEEKYQDSEDGSQEDNKDQVPTPAPTTPVPTGGGKRKTPPPLYPGTEQFEKKYSGHNPKGEEVVRQFLGQQHKGSGNTSWTKILGFIKKRKDLNRTTEMSATQRCQAWDGLRTDIIEILQQNGWFDLALLWARLPQEQGGVFDDEELFDGLVDRNGFGESLGGSTIHIERLDLRNRIRSVIFAFLDRQSPWAKQLRRLPKSRPILAWIRDLDLTIYKFDPETIRATYSKLCLMRWTKDVSIPTFFQLFDDIVEEYNMQKGSKMCSEEQYGLLLTGMASTGTTLKADGYPLFRFLIKEFETKHPSYTMTEDLLSSFTDMIAEEYQRLRNTGICPQPRVTPHALATQIENNNRDRASVPQPRQTQQPRQQQNTTGHQQSPPSQDGSFNGVPGSTAWYNFHNTQPGTWGGPTKRVWRTSRFGTRHCLYQVCHRAQRAWT